MAIVDFDIHVRKHRSLAPNRAAGARIATRVRRTCNHSALIGVVGGVMEPIEIALKAAAIAFGDGALTDGAPVLINEIGEPPRVRVVAQARRPNR